MTIQRLILLLTIAFSIVLSPDGGSIVSAQGVRHIAILGDSNTWLGGDACDKEKGWTKWFCDALKPASCVSYARSGATWSNSDNTKPNIMENVGVISDDNVIMNQILRLRKAVDCGDTPVPDLIIIAAGTNDAWFNDKRPQAFVDDYDSYTSIAGAVMLNCKALQEHYPKAKILLLTPLQSTAVSITKINQAGEIIQACGHSLNAFVIRQDKVMKVKRNNEAKRKVYTYDGTHTSVKGARSNGEYIARWILTNIK